MSKKHTTEIELKGCACCSCGKNTTRRVYTTIEKCDKAHLRAGHSIIVIDGKNVHICKTCVRKKTIKLMSATEAFNKHNALPVGGRMYVGIRS